MIKFYLFIVGLGITFASAPAYAIAHLELVGAANSSSTTIQGTPYTADGLGYGAGVLASAGLGRVGVEVGLIYSQHKVHNVSVSGGYTIDTKLNGTVTEIPAFLRFRLIRFLSLGVGAYYASYSKVVVSQTINGAVVIPTGLTTMKGNDEGLVAGGGVHIPFGMFTSLVFDVFFYNSLKTEIKDKQTQYLAGLSFGF